MSAFVFYQQLNFNFLSNVIQLNWQILVLMHNCIFIIRELELITDFYYSLRQRSNLYFIAHNFNTLVGLNHF